jgi:hypothetical protein
MSDYEFSKVCYNNIIEWAKKHFTGRKQAEKELSWYKIHDETPWPRILKKLICGQTFSCFYYGEDANLTECKPCRHAQYKPNTGRGKTLVAYKNLRYFLFILRL